MISAGNCIRASLAAEGLGPILLEASSAVRLRAIRSVTKIACIGFLLSIFCGPFYAQDSAEQGKLVSAQTSLPQPQSGTDPAASEAAPGPAQPPQDDSAVEGRQPKRILWVIPNYRAVSANTHLPPLHRKQKLWLATEDSFDYSSFLLAGIVAGIGQARNDTPEFGHGGLAYGRYYWHTFTDEVVGNYFTEALLPIATRQDPRYYTLGHGGFLHRTGYSLTRLLITRTDSGHNTFNSSEILGNLAGAALSDLYYPRPERTWGKTGEKWLLQLGIDAFFDIAKEFWPDVDQRVFHGRYGSHRH